MEPEPSDTTETWTFQPVGLGIRMLDWATDERELDLFDLGKLFELLARDPADRTAAAAIFWACQAACEHCLSTAHLPSDECPPGLHKRFGALYGNGVGNAQTDRYWRQMSELPEHPMLQASTFLEWAPPLNAKDPFVALFWGAGLVTVMVDEARRNSVMETDLYYHEDLRRVIEATYAAGSLIDPSVFEETGYWYCADGDLIARQRHIEFSAAVAMGHTGVQRGTMLANSGNIAAGFETMARSVYLIGYAWVLVGGMYMANRGGPFATTDSRGGYEQLRFWFEQLLAEPERVQDWERVRTACSDARDALEPEETVRENWQPGECPYMPVDWLAYETAYWRVAEALTEAHLSPDQLVRTLRLREQEQHQARLVTDTMYDTWDSMEADTQQALISAESTWYGARRAQGRTGSVLNDLRVAFEVELRACLAPLRGTIESLLRDSDLRARHRLTSLRADGLNLGDIARLLQSASDTKDLSALGLRNALVALSLTKQEQEFLVTRLPTFIGPLWAARNVAEHEFKWTLENVARFRRQALGIDTSGYLPALVRLKRNIRAGLS